MTTPGVLTKHAIEADNEYSNFCREHTHKQTATADVVTGRKFREAE